MEFRGTTTLTVEQLADWDDAQLDLANQVLSQEQDEIRAERRKINAAKSMRAARVKVADLSEAERAALLAALTPNAGA